jgi:hypothetical protein
MDLGGRSDAVNKSVSYYVDKSNELQPHLSSRRICVSFVVHVLHIYKLNLRAGYRDTNCPGSEELGW